MKLEFAITRDGAEGRIAFNGAAASYRDVEAIAEQIFAAAALLWPEDAGDGASEESAGAAPEAVAPEAAPVRAEMPPSAAPSRGKRIFPRPEPESADGLSELQRRVLPLARSGLAAAAIAERIGGGVSPNGVGAVIGGLKRKGLL